MSTSEQSERLKKLSPAKRALLIQALQKEAARDKQPETIPRREGQGNAPLSFAQQRMWLIDRLESGSVAYNVPFAVHLKGRLDVAAFEQSINRIIERHEVLRTTFELDGDQPTQVIAAALALSVPVLSLEETPAGQREEEARRLAAEEARRPFNLMKGPLLRVALLRLEEQDYVALITMHHIVSDGWSDAIFIQEMVALYEAALAGRPSPLPELPIQYADFAIWQRERLQGESLRDLLAFWKEELAGAAPLLELPTDYPRPPAPTHQGAIESRVFPKPVYEALRALSREAGVTMFVILLAVFKTLLYRYTGQSDVVVGTPVANRTRLETEGLIGFFLNTLALRTDLSGNPTFRQLLEHVQATTLAAQAHQDLPFELLVESLGLERNLSYAPIFQVLFVYQNKPVEKLERAGLALTSIEVHSGTSKSDLNLVVVEGADDQHTANLEYNTDLFDAATIQRLLAHFETLLTAVAARPDQRIAELPLLTRAEEHQLLRLWNNTATSYPDQRGLHHPFETQAATTPDAIALVFEAES
ncbi:MAG TPA: condensation domain-containing protein, partial [Pyrinomonadaceae bacterium]|nr:condensation domain-containing protein [Pyrinomonadaceae bacterium]